MRTLSLPCLLVAVLACSGCFEVYQAGISVHASGTQRTTWSTAETPPELAFTVSNDHAEAIGAIQVRIHLEVLSGGSSHTDAQLDLASTPAGVTGGDGSWRIAGLGPGQTVVLKPTTFFEPGTYRLTTTISPEASVEERSTDDNVAVLTFSVTAAPAIAGLDLSVGAPTAMSLSGDDILLTVPVTVTGPAGGTAHLVRIDVSTADVDRWWSLHSDLPVGTHALQLKAAAHPDGTSEIEIQVDPTGYIPESDEGNNGRTATFLAGAG